MALSHRLLQRIALSRRLLMELSPSADARNPSSQGDVVVIGTGCQEYLGQGAERSKVI